MDVIFSAIYCYWYRIRQFDDSTHIGVELIIVLWFDKALVVFDVEYCVNI